MPRFLLPIFVLVLISSVGFGFVVLKLDPEQPVSVILFLVTLFLSLVSVLSVLLFFLHKKLFFKPKTFSALGPVVLAEDLRPLFRTSLRNSFLIALLVTLLLVLQRLR